MRGPGAVRADGEEGKVRTCRGGCEVRGTWGGMEGCMEGSEVKVSLKEVKSCIVTANGNSSNT